MIEREEDRKFLFRGSDMESHMPTKTSSHTSCHITSNTQTFCLSFLHSYLILSRHVSVFTVALLSLTSRWTQFIFGWRPCPVSIQTSCAAVDPVQLAPTRCYFGNNWRHLFVRKFHRSVKAHAEQPADVWGKTRENSFEVLPETHNNSECFHSQTRTQLHNSHKKKIAGVCAKQK